MNAAFAGLHALLTGTAGMVGEVTILVGVVAGMGRSAPRCRLEVAAQGRGWQQAFQPGVPWPVKAVLVHGGGAAEAPVVHVEAIELLDFRGRVVARRRNVRLPQQPMREKGPKAVTLRVDGAVRGEDTSRAHRLRLKGRVVPGGWRHPRGRPFSFLMDVAGPHDGTMEEGIW